MPEALEILAFLSGCLFGFAFGAGSTIVLFADDLFDIGDIDDICEECGCDLFDGEECYCEDCAVVCNNDGIKEKGTI